MIVQSYVLLAAESKSGEKSPAKRKQSLAPPPDAKAGAGGRRKSSVAPAVPKDDKIEIKKEGGQGFGISLIEAAVIKLRIANRSVAASIFFIRLFLSLLRVLFLSTRCLKKEPL